MSFEETVKSFEKKFPKGNWSVRKGVVSKKEAEKKGTYEAYVCSDLNIGESNHFFSIELGFNAESSLKNAVEAMEAKIDAFNKEKKLLKEQKK